jgi:hypothetical protein
LKLRILIACLLLALVTLESRAQTLLTAPLIGACPSPVPPVWPASTCRYQFYPLTDTVHAAASVSKTAPVYQHTYGGYSVATTLLVACPAGATLSADTKQCTGPDGLDASALVAKSAIPSFAIAPAPPPPAVLQDVTVTAVDAPAAAALFPKLPTPECFTLSNGTQSVTACIPPK